jgi:hypothetical protein
MATNKTTSGQTFARHVAPFAPLALALAMNAVPSHTARPQEAEVPQEVTAATCDEVLDFQDCHTRYPTGCSAAAGYDAALNLLKNVLIPPPGPDPQKYLTMDDFKNLDTNTPSGLSARNHADFGEDLQKMGEGKIFGIVGYLYYFQHTGAESTNCQLEGPVGEANPQDNYTNVDYHIGIGFDPPPNNLTKRDAQQNSVIVEMTPYSRFLYANGKWTLETLQQALHKKVRVVGQLIVDNEHDVATQNCALAESANEKTKCWRASAWELHPVVRFQYCPTDACTATSQDWVELGP